MEFTSYEVPALICESCVKDLKVAIKFRNRARSSDKSYFRSFSFDVEELSWNKKLIKLKKNDYDTLNDIGDPSEDPSVKCETVVEEYLESDQELDDALMVIDEENEKEMKLEKGVERIFQCEYCMQILSTKKGLDYHLKVKHDHNVTAMFACEVRFNQIYYCTMTDKN